MFTHQPVIAQTFAKELVSSVLEILKALPLTKGLFEGNPQLDARINEECLSYINRLRTPHELFKNASQISRDVDAAAQCALMALNKLPEFHPHLEGNVTFYHHLSTILKGRFTEAAIKLQLT